MRANEFLIERYVNLFTPDQKENVSEVVWDMLQKSYAEAGGFHSAANVNELIHDSGLWKLVTRNGVITAVLIYKDKFGRKAIATATNQTRTGLVDYLKVTHDDIRWQRSWAEVSGKPEHIMKKAGARPIPAKFAHFLTGKQITHIDDDGIHYTRLIMGEPHVKAIYGCANLTPELEHKLMYAGIHLHSLPENLLKKV